MRGAAQIPVVSLIYNRYARASASQDAVVEVRIYYHRRVKYMSTYVRLLPHEWKNGRVVNRCDAVELNRMLDKLIIDIRKVVYDMYEEGHIDIFAIPARIEAKRKPVVSLQDFMAERAKIRKYGKAEDSQDRYDRFIRKFEEWGGIKTFYDLRDEKKIMAFDKYLRKKGMKDKSIWNNYHRFLNSFILDARKEGILQVNPYDNVHIERGNDYDGIDKFLFPDEFQKVRAAKMPSEQLERIRDLFVFQTYCCFSYCDIAKFSTKKWNEMKILEVINGSRGKTGIEYIIPLLSPAKEILKKYNGLPSTMTTKKSKAGRHILTNQKYNLYLKEVMKAAGIDKPVTTHWARHTGATLLLNAGAPLQVVSRVLGHSSIKITERIYAKLLEHTVVDKVLEVEDKVI